MLSLPPFLRASAVGLAATAVDLVLIAALVQLAHVPATVANVPALLVGALVQFLGCRYVVFRDTRTPLARALPAFAAAEVGTLLLNAVLFHVLVAFLAVPYPAARPLGQLVVFVGFSYPAWRRAFA